MKRIVFVVFVIIISFIGINNVFAFEEYEIKLNSGNSVLRRVDGDNYTEITDTAIKNSIYSYVEDAENSTWILTLKEGIHYYNIESDRYGEVEFTSNDKLVYINNIKGNWIKFNHLNSEGYTSTSTHDLVYPGDGIKNHVHVGHLDIYNSTFKFFAEGSIEEGQIHTEPPENSEYGNLTISNSTVVTKGTIYAPKGKKVIIKDGSNVFARAIISGIINDIDSNDELQIKNSYVETLGDEVSEVYNYVFSSLLMCANKIVVENSEIRTNGTITSNDLNITNSTVGFKAGAKKFYLPTFAGLDITFKNVEAKVKGGLVGTTIDFENTYLEVETGKSTEVFEITGNKFDYSTSSAFIGDVVTLKNSNFRAKTDGTVPAVAIRTSITSDVDSFDFKDNDEEIVEFKKVNLDDYGFLTVPSGYTVNYNAIALASFTNSEGYTAVKGTTALSETATTESKTITLKIINGTWEDGTTETITMKVPKDRTIDKNLITTIAKTEGDVVVVTETGTNEYTFEYMSKEKAEEIEKEKNKTENPKTGVEDFIGLLILSIMCVVLFIINKDKVSTFKEI